MPGLWGCCLSFLVPAPGTSQCTSQPGCCRFQNILSCTDRYIVGGKSLFPTEEINCWELPTFFFLGFVTEYFPGPGVFFPVAVLAGKAIGCFSVLFTQKQLILREKFICIFRTCG